MFTERPRLGLAVRIRSFLRFAFSVLTAGPDELPMLLRTRPGYWRFAHVLRRGGTSVTARLLRAGYYARRSRDDAAGVAGLLRATAWPSLAALAALVVVELIAIGFHHLAVSSSNRLVRLAVNLLSWLGTPVPPEKFEGMLTAIAGAGVGALALYFAGVGVVAATVYADVPGRVRGLFVAERSSRAYTQALAVLVVWCVAVLAMRIGSYQPHRLSLFMIVGVAVFAVINLVHLGQRVFNFFDPVALSRELPAGFLNNVRAARADSGRSGDPAFQAAYQRVADLHLTTLRQIVELATRSRRQAEPASLLTLVGRIDGLWAAYAVEKTRIPRDSGWFERVPAHADWLRSDHLQTSMALATSTDVQATLAADRMWVERRLLRMLGVLSDALVASEDPALAYQVVGRLTARAERLARMGAVAEALQAMRAVGRIVDTLSDNFALRAEQTLVPLEAPARNALGALAVADEEGRGAAAMVIGIVEWAAFVLDRETFAGHVHRAVRSRSDRYQAGLPDCLLDPLEQLATSLRFERAVEGRVITPDWFVEQVVAKAAVDHLAESLDAILRLAGEVVNRAEKLTGDGHVVLAAAVTGRGLELCDKLLSHLPRAAAVLSEATRNYCRDPDPLWLADPVPAHLPSVKGLRRRLLSMAARLIGPLAGHARDSGMPDAFGRFYAVLLAEAHEALLTGDDALFAELFPAVSGGAALAFQRLRAEPQKMDPRLAVPAITRPLVELLELSGAALLLTELHGGTAWETVVSGWDRLLHGLEDLAATAGIYSVALDTHQPAVLFDRGRMARDSRWRRIAQHLRQQGVATGLNRSGLNRQRRAHPSAIVRVMAAGGGLYRLHDLFAVRYLAGKLPELELPDSARRLQDALEHRGSRPRPRAHPGTDQSSAGMDDEGGDRHVHPE